MQPQLRHCCCGCTLETGTLLIGGYQLVRGMLEFISDLMIESSVSLNSGRVGWKYILEGAPILMAVLGILRMIAAAFLIFGANKERPPIIYWWLVFIAALTILSFAIFPLSLSSFYYYSNTTGFVITLTFGLVDFGLELYFMLVVNSFYSIIKGRTPAPDSPAV